MTGKDDQETGQQGEQAQEKGAGRQRGRHGSGNILERSGNTFLLRFDVAEDPGGNRRQKTVTFRGTRRQAQAELNRLLAEVQSGGYVEPSKLTVAQYLRRWLDDYAKPNVAGKTFERYEQIVNLHLVPAIGTVPLARLKPLQVQQTYTALLENGRNRKPGGLSPRTVLHVHRILSEALKQAVRWQMVARNVCDAVEPPSVGEKEMRIVDVEGAARLIAAAKDTEMYVPVVLALSTGLRRGELAGLRWSDLDFDTATLTVNRSVEVTKDGLAFKEPKTRRSRRSVTLPALAVEVLLQHKAQQAELRLALGPAYQAQGLVLAEHDGSLVHPDRLTGGFRRLAKKAGVEGVRLHDTRHSHASHLLAQGETLRLISDRLGHADPAFTLRTYAHMLPGAQEEAAKRLDAALRAAF